jgi:tRNA pseudouridine55 synthase
VERPAVPGVFGLLNLYKPAGPTSHDLVAWVRRGTGVKKVGHAGTLDPAAAGVLVLCLGPATRLSEYLMGSPKTYVARLHFGVETDTYDAEGAITAQDSRPLTRAALEAALERFRGEIAQVPPMHSAIKQGGRRLYDLARAGQTVERVGRAVTISRLVLAAWEPPVAVLEIECSPGTYIRSLAHDLGQAVGVGAHLAALERTASGSFTAADAVPWPAFRAAMEAGTWAGHLIPPDRALAAYPALHLDAEGTAAVLNGRLIAALPETGGHDLARAYDPQGRLIAVLERRGPAWKPHKVFAGAGGER